MSIEGVLRWQPSKVVPANESCDSKPVPRKPPITSISLSEAVLESRRNCPGWNKCPYKEANSDRLATK